MLDRVIRSINNAISNASKNIKNDYLKENKSNNIKSYICDNEDDTYEINIDIEININNQFSSSNDYDDYEYWYDEEDEKRRREEEEEERIRRYEEEEEERRHDEEFWEAFSDYYDDYMKNY